MFKIWKREPNVFVGGKERPYMLRWYILPRNRWLNIYLHKFCRDDDDRALHDHPWWFLSIMLLGRYLEHTEHVSGNGQYTLTIHCQKERRAPSIAFRRAEHKHRIELPKQDGEPVSCWTLVITGRRVRDWGFHCPQGWRHWREFVSPKDEGETGRGCD